MLPPATLSCSLPLLFPPPPHSVQIVNVCLVERPGRKPIPFNSLTSPLLTPPLSSSFPCSSLSTSLIFLVGGEEVGDDGDQGEWDIIITLLLSPITSFSCSLPCFFCTHSTFCFFHLNCLFLTRFLSPLTVCLYCVSSLFCSPLPADHMPSPCPLSLPLSLTCLLDSLSLSSSYLSSSLSLSENARARRKSIANVKQPSMEIPPTAPPQSFRQSVSTPPSYRPRSLPPSLSLSLPFHSPPHTCRRASGTPPFPLALSPSLSPSLPHGHSCPQQRYKKGVGTPPLLRSLPLSPCLSLSLPLSHPSSNWPGDWRVAASSPVTRRHIAPLPPIEVHDSDVSVCGEETPSKLHVTSFAKCDGVFCSLCQM